MQVLRHESTGNRRVALVEHAGWFAVRIEVRGPTGWEDISLRVDQDLAFEVASRRYRLRVAEQEARAIDWGSE